MQASSDDADDGSPPAVPSYPSGGVSSGVQDAIRRDIITGTLLPGERVTEASLAQRYAVSRVPVREALRGLESEGFIASRPHAGSRVAAIPMDEAEDLFDVRETLEVATARRAAARAAALWSRQDSPQEWWDTRRELARLLDRGDEVAARDDLDALVDVNDRLHLAIGELAASPTLQRLLRQLSWKIEWLYASDRQARGSGRWPDHRAIVSAIDAGDPDRAGELMREHVRGTRSTFFARYASRLPPQGAGSEA
ncbi:GntR family transcriptional regulator [Microbacterium betulae]|uniref:GntR family transcriptional regulator n=1 Tax=Microbacterium betulae TaxID=2981139 RepID=A0AA97FHM1_9MICO|nr:GntR family transcriptional regulator [Microbacterium sp. AB]WOF22729.1 GntR family transcriptional regulator [Microbacterium sp. AB]